MVSRVPHVFVILFSVILLAAIATYVVTPGEYDRAEDANGRMIAVDGSYHSVEAERAGFMDVFQSIYTGMNEASDIIFYIFIVGGSFGILRSTNVIEGAVGSISQRMAGREKLIIPVLMVFFALGGAMLGLAEETIPYITILVPLMLRLGFDSMTGAAIVLLGTSAGFASAFMNPFTVGVAQGIAQIPVFSGLGLRLVMWVVFVGVSIWFVMRYADKVKKDPKSSITYDSDLTMKEKQPQTEQFTGLTGRQKLVLTILLATLVVLAIGVSKLGWYLTEIAGLFLLMGILMGIVSKLSLNNIAEAFIEGCRTLVMGALVVGVARGILVILQDGKIMDTILYGLANAVGSLPSGLTAIGMYIVQCLISYIIPSGSGQAAVTMPIMAPLGDLVGVTRQTAVLAFQLGDGISNIFTPTSGYFMAGLALAGVSWVKWAKWILPLIIGHYLLGALFVTIAHLIGYQ
ncbi:YfcC family protein [Brevibacillus choshinensis]|uniref:C4-dicarboxylate ABC transporter permease n=1 Tax=Brevibacillus choshinensis TaxID=54911 RepID=A0ABR5N5T8_BRECH|nr:YfcC family protein [Brevibacillus choshinensis]KQL45995.1 C4-dicarboxylate ABC transporter permease [Brevibacillus choshinensis]MED4584334.1 YfcC family protein [Brevibacillus choshinensis]MED4751979.1 YfcC family protein [Brevibacillus choshinensis]MED4784274.1 YfcC family protein [Brevibacillus choshinensis]